MAAANVTLADVTGTGMHDDTDDDVVMNLLDEIETGLALLLEREACTSSATQSMLSMLARKAKAAIKLYDREIHDRATTEVA
jgi:hypothetical protein